MPIAYGQVKGKRYDAKQPLVTKRCVICEREKPLDHFEKLTKKEYSLICNECKEDIDDLK